MTALALLAIAPDSLEDRLEVARAAQSWPAVAVAISVAILLFWLISRLGDDEAAAPEAPAEPEARARVTSMPTCSGVRVVPQARTAEALDKPRAA